MILEGSRPTLPQLLTRNTLAKGAGVNSLLIKIPNAKPNPKPKAKAEARKPLWNKGFIGAKINSAESIYLLKKYSIRVYA